MAEERKKSGGRRAYLNDFVRTADGGMVYTGKHYAYADGLPRRRAMVKLCAVGGAAALAAVGQGFLPIPSMQGCFYVLLPYVGELIAAHMLLWAAVKLWFLDEPMREYVYEKTVQAITPRSALTAIFAGATLLGETAYLLLRGMMCPERELPFLGLNVLALTAAMAAKRLIASMHWEQVSGGD